MKRFLVTGGAGFIGSHFCEMALSQNWCSALLNVDALTYAGNLRNLESVSNLASYKFERLDVSDEGSALLNAFVEFEPTHIFHFAAESHVDRSIVSPDIFLKTNVLGTHQMLRATLALQEKSKKPLRFIMVSTDEVYGSLGPTGYFTEETPLSPRSPYSASKASADMLTSAFHHTYAMDTITVRCSNNYGPRQFPEKLIPQTIIRAMQDKRIPVYGSGENVRDWIFVTDFVEGIYAASNKGKSGEAYNFGGASEKTNIDVVKMILGFLNKPESLIEFVTDRKGHDFRYAIDFTKSKRELGWYPKHQFTSGLESAVRWYEQNNAWWSEILSGEYQKFFESYYQNSSSRLRAKS